MATDDDKQMPDPDPWAGLDVGGADGEAEETTFSFEEFAEPAPEEPAAFAERDELPAKEPGSSSDVEPIDVFAAEMPPSREVPLAVFPPADALEGDGDLDEMRLDHTHDDSGATGPDPESEHGEASDVISLSAGGETAAAEPTAADAWGAAVAEGEDAPVAAWLDSDTDADDFDDRLLAQELAAMDDGADDSAVSTAADFGDIDAESGPASEELSFDTVGAAATAPFAIRSDDSSFEPPEEGEDAFPAGVGEAAEGDALASIPLTAAVAAASGLSTAPTPKKKSSGLGTALGVVGGGLLALPVTYAILLWGLQKDPFKLGRHLPQAILPAGVRSGAKPVRKPAAAPVLDAGKSLDALPMSDAVPAAPSAEETAADAAPPAATSDVADGEAKPEMVEAATKQAAPAPGDVAASPPPAESIPAASSDAAAAIPAPAIAPPADLAPAPAISPPPDLAAPAAIAPPSGLEGSAPTAGAAPSAEPPIESASPAAMPKEDALASLDALVTTPVVAPAAAPAVEPSPPLDVTAADDATALVGEALDALETHPAEAGESRDRLLVGWYRRLATLGEELVRLQTTAYDTGRQVEATPESAAALLDRISASDRALADLDSLGGMWITSATRQADGVSLVADVVATRQVGPYWSTKMLVAGGNADGSPREVSIISRTPPPDEADGGRVLVTGVLFDGGAVWAADIRPVASPAADADVAEPAAAETPAEKDATEPAAADPGGP